MQNYMLEQIPVSTDICAARIADDVEFEGVSISDIRETDDYPGICVALKANCKPISILACNNLEAVGEILP